MLAVYAAIIELSVLGQAAEGALIGVVEKPDLQLARSIILLTALPKLWAFYILPDELLYLLLFLF